MPNLSQSQISSFVGNVIPLKLLGVEEYGMEKILWSVEGDSVQLKSYADDPVIPFTDGVLLTLLSEGDATVKANYQGEIYTCTVSVHSGKHEPSGRGFSYYIGDFHNHTQRTHKADIFPLREEQTPYDFLKQVADEGVLDFCVVSDHSCVLSGREYFRGFWDAYRLGEDKIIPFPGSEAQCTPKEEDRYGVLHALGGEIVTVNADFHGSVSSWEDFFNCYKTSPFAISVLAHPQIIGWSTPGVWNFRLHQNNSPRFREMVKGIEMGNGTDGTCTHSYEYTYSVALDNGFFASTTCASDNHSIEWTSKKFPGRTIILAKEKTKEAFFDAIQSRRFYASESGNVKVYYEVNGVPAPATSLPEAEEYRFHLEIGLLREELGGMPTHVRVVSDYGKTVFETDQVEEVMDFTIKSSTARYFYLRLWDDNGQKTWSFPVLTGRKSDEPTKWNPQPADKKGWTAYEEEAGQDAGVIICDDPRETFYAGRPTCSILIDMQTPTEISALGHYAPILNNKTLIDAGFKRNDGLSEIAVSYEIETGLTKEDMTKKAKGSFRIFGEEEYVPFEKHEARYVRVKILSTVGKETGRAAYQNHQVSIGELTLYN